MKKKIDKKKGVAVCEDCNYRYDNPINLNANAAKHAKAFGHKVVFELKLEGYYDGRKNDGGK